MHLVSLSGFEDEVGILAIAHDGHKENGERDEPSEARRGVRRKAPSLDLVR